MIENKLILILILKMRVVIMNLPITYRLISITKRSLQNHWNILRECLFSTICILTYVTDSKSLTTHYGNVKKKVIIQELQHQMMSTKNISIVLDYEIRMSGHASPKSVHSKSAHSKSAHSKSAHSKSAHSKSVHSSLHHQLFINPLAHTNDSKLLENHELISVIDFFSKYLIEIY